MNPIIKIANGKNSSVQIKLTSYPTSKATIKILDTNNMVNNFLTLVKGSADEYKNYISKGAFVLDLDEVKAIMEGSKNYKQLLDGSKNILTKKFMKKSILFFNENKRQIILHIYLTKEPDIYSDWKILYIKKESNRIKTL